MAFTFHVRNKNSGPTARYSDANIAQINKQHVIHGLWINGSHEEDDKNFDLWGTLNSQTKDDQVITELSFLKRKFTPFEAENDTEKYWVSYLTKPPMNFILFEFNKHGRYIDFDQVPNFEDKIKIKRLRKFYHFLTYVTRSKMLFNQYKLMLASQKEDLLGESLSKKDQFYSMFSKKNRLTKKIIIEDNKYFQIHAQKRVDPKDANLTYFDFELEFDSNLDIFTYDLQRPAQSQSLDRVKGRL